MNSGAKSKRVGSHAVDRELVLAVLALLAAGPLLKLAGIRKAPPDIRFSHGGRERFCWQNVWMPLVPAGVVLCALGGWALLEPANAEKLPATWLAAAIPFAVVWMRAGLRAVASLGLTPRVSTAGTLGLLKPRVVLCPEFASTIDVLTAQAARGHEEAHVRHRDPLRVYLARFATDLQWPGRGAQRRFRRWRHALEIARDDEARRLGVDGADLAAAVIAALRFNAAKLEPFPSVIGDPADLQDRICNLLAPLQVDVRDESSRLVLPRLVIAGALAAPLLGARFGELIVRTLVHSLQ